MSANIDKRTIRELEKNSTAFKNAKTQDDKMRILSQLIAENGAQAAGGLVAGGGNGLAWNLELKGDKVPNYVQLLQNSDLKNPGFIAHLTFQLGTGLERPNRVVLTRGGALTGNKWDAIVDRAGANSGLVLFWDPNATGPDAVRLPTTVRTPGPPTPGDRVPTVLTVPVMVPVPRSVVPNTVVTLLVMEPVTERAPTLTLVAPV